MDVRPQCQTAVSDAARCAPVSLERSAPKSSREFIIQYSSHSSCCFIPSYHSSYHSCRITICLPDTMYRPCLILNCTEFIHVCRCARGLKCLKTEFDERIPWIYEGRCFQKFFVDFLGKRPIGRQWVEEFDQSGRDEANQQSINQSINRTKVEPTTSRARDTWYIISHTNSLH